MNRGLCGDIRIAERYEKLVEAMANAGTVVVKKLGGTRAEEMGAHRFLGSPRVTPEGILGSHARATARVEGRRQTCPSLPRRVLVRWPRAQVQRQAVARTTARSLTLCGHKVAEAADEGLPRDSISSHHALPSEMLRQLQPLVLVVRGLARAVELISRVGELFEHQPTDRLAVLEQERDVAGTHLEHGARCRASVRSLPEPRIEKAGVMDAELADRRVDRRHLGGEVGPGRHSAQPAIPGRGFKVIKALWRIFRARLAWQVGRGGFERPTFLERGTGPRASEGGRSHYGRGFNLFKDLRRIFRALVARRGGAMRVQGSLPRHPRA